MIQHHSGHGGGTYSWWYYVITNVDMGTASCMGRPRLPATYEYLLGQFIGYQNLVGTLLIVKIEKKNVPRLFIASDQINGTLTCYENSSDEFQWNFVHVQNFTTSQRKNKSEVDGKKPPGH